MVEDYEFIRTALCVLLERSGLEVCQAGTVAQALAMLDGQDVAIPDLTLPDGSGLQVLDRIRSEGRPMRVAVLTAIAESKALALAKGADVFFSKPLLFEHIELLLDWVNGAT
ncbi:MAG: two component transcriptional regulator, winged helix family protein [Phycisphaerales bacterium]|nr:two component transcriptional regulator, winged helix family protein [Phycisphaerales bacterium]